MWYCSIKIYDPTKLLYLPCAFSCVMIAPNSSSKSLHWSVLLPIKIVTKRKTKERE